MIPIAFVKYEIQYPARMISPRPTYRTVFILPYRKAVCWVLRKLRVPCTCARGWREGVLKRSPETNTELRVLRVHKTHPRRKNTRIYCVEKTTGGLYTRSFMVDLLSEIRPITFTRFRDLLWLCSLETRERPCTCNLQLHGDRRSACASGTDGRHAGGAAVASGRGSLRPRLARRTNQ